MCVNSFVFTSCANFLATFFHFLSNRIEYYLQRAESAKYHEWMCNLGCPNKDLNNVQKRYNQNAKLFIESRIHPSTKFRFLTLPSSVTNFYSYQYQRLRRPDCILSILQTTSVVCVKQHYKLMSCLLRIVKYLRSIASVWLQWSHIRKEN